MALGQHRGTINIEGGRVLLVILSLVSLCRFAVAAFSDRLTFFSGWEAAGSYEQSVVETGEEMVVPRHNVKELMWISGVLISVQGLGILSDTSSLS